MDRMLERDTKIEDIPASRAYICVYMLSQCFLFVLEMPVLISFFSATLCIFLLSTTSVE